MQSLFKATINWYVFLIFAIAIFLLFPNLSWFSYIALIISFHQFLLLFYSIDHFIPIRYLSGTLMCLQMFIGPVLAYNGVDDYQYFNYKMKIPESEYFTYVIPAVICFIIGLHFTAGKLKGEFIKISDIQAFTNNHEELPFWFIGIGFVSSIVAAYFSSDLAFVFYLLGNFKYIGAFLLIISKKQLNALTLFIVFGSIILSSLGSGMFHDLLTWIMMGGAVLAIKYKPGIKIRIFSFFLFLLIAIVIQQVKGTYRSSILGGQEAGIETFQKVVQESNDDNTLFSSKSMAISTVRINQGFIITNIMVTVPAKVPFAYGSELQSLLEAAILPRILAPDKLKAGDRTLFTKYSGLNLRQGTSMGLSSVGDAYINFGIVGGCVFMFFLGLLFNLVLKAFFKFERNYPILILFTALVFYYPIRPDCELQTILGHLVKACFLIFIIFFFWKKQFRVQPAES